MLIFVRNKHFHINSDIYCNLTLGHNVLKSN